MPTKEEVIKRYGKEVWDRMVKSGWLTGITCEMNPDGTIDIPECDIDRAYRSAMGGYVSALEWD